MIDQVSALLREVAAQAVMPRWRQLQPHEITEKEKGDLVTAADHEAEDLLTDALRQIKPGSAVIGEEAAAANPAILADFGALPALWLVDPVDGTNNFIRGSDRFALMVAYLERGVVRASWIYLPTQEKLAVAEAGAGAWINARRVLAPEPPKAIGNMTGAAHVNRLPEPLKQQVKGQLKHFRGNRPAYCAGFDYVALLEGTRHFSLYNRTLPWDHAPGTFLLAEAGGKSARFDGSAFVPDELDEYGKGRGLLSAPTSESWTRIRDALFARD